MRNDDLISRSALLDSYDVRKVTEYDESGCGMDYKAVPVDVIAAAPAVDAAPVRHGRWAHMGGDEWYCTVCTEVIHTEGSWEKPTDKYCHECGAKMDGDMDALD